MHKTVLLEEAVNSLNLKRGDVIVDATLGAGGHSLKIAEAIGENGKVICFDVDEKAIEEFRNKLTKNFPFLKERFELINENFSNILSELKKRNIKKVDGILADLGWRIEQIEQSGYGMSFNDKKSLDMRMDGDEEKESARDIVNHWEEKDLAELFWKYGEEKNSRKVAKMIVDFRKKKEFKNAQELAEFLQEKLGRFYRKSKIHPATKIFQALRIQVNGELENLEKFLEFSKSILKPKARIVVISFHSLEDRIVKRFFKSNTGGCVCPKGSPICTCGAKAIFRIITKKPFAPAESEIQENPRSRSAKMRVAEKI